MKQSRVKEEKCVACGSCEVECPRGAIEVKDGCFAVVSSERCIGCGLCVTVCPTGALSIIEVMTDE